MIPSFRGRGMRANAALVQPLNPPAYRAVQNVGSTTATLTINKPTVSEGQLLVACIWEWSTRDFTPPEGWTLVTGVTTTIRSALYTKVAGGSEPSSYAWTVSDSQTWGGAIASYTTVDTANPVHKYSSGSGSGTVLTAPSVTTEYNNCMAVLFGAINGDKVWAVPDGWSRRVSGTRLNVDDKAFETAGATGAGVITQNGNVAWVIIMALLKGA